MPLELLLLLALIVLWPLLQQFLWAAPQQPPGRGVPERADRPDQRQGRSKSVDRVQETPRIRRQAPAPAVGPARPARRLPADAPELMPGGPPVRRHVQRGGIAATLRHPRHLRRAMVLMAVLGPCRAIAPHD